MGHFLLLLLAAFVLRVQIGAACHTIMAHNCINLAKYDIKLHRYVGLVLYDVSGLSEHARASTFAVFTIDANFMLQECSSCVAAIVCCPHTP